ncbi:unnamed protein product, partial [Phaeothamnion confervicola]
LPLNGLENGNHSVEVVPLDLTGLEGDTWRTSWNVDLTRPETRVDMHPPPVTPSTYANFNFSCTGAAAPCTYRASLDGSSPVEVRDTLTLRALASGAHTLAVTATDLAGNVGEELKFSWAVNTARPQTVLVAKPPAETHATSAHFTLLDTVGVGAGKGSGFFEYQLDGGGAGNSGGKSGSWTRFDSTSLSLYGLADGVHALLVRAATAGGATDKVPQRHEWRIDTSCPDTSMVVFPSPVTHLRSAVLVVQGESAGGPVAGFEYSHNGGSWVGVNLAGVVHLSDLTDGQQTLAVRAVNAAGNADASPATTAWIVDRA